MILTRNLYSNISNETRPIIIEEKPPKFELLNIINAGRYNNTTNISSALFCFVLFVRVRITLVDYISISFLRQQALRSLYIPFDEWVSLTFFFSLFMQIHMH
jgi:hypothetical protein